jgi:hypothetical protein
MPKRAGDELAVALQLERICLLCFEADHSDGHRSVIVEELERRVPGLIVEHLQGLGRGASLAALARTGCPAGLRLAVPFVVTVRGSRSPRLSA